MIITDCRSLTRPAIRRALVLTAFAGFVSVALVDPARAQGGIIDRVKAKVKDKTDAATDSLTDAAFDRATGAVKCVATNSACIKKAFDAGHNVKLVDAKGNPVSATDSSKAVATAGGVPETLAASNAVAPAQAFGDSVFLNYDFVPGDRVIFAEDFTRDKPGDFPKRLQLRRGNLEIADWQGQHFLRTNSSSVVAIPLPELLPQRFTFEADYNGGGGWSMTVNFADPDVVDGLTTASFSPSEGGLSGDNVSSSATIPDAAIKPITHIAVMADSAYAKVYVNGVRVANVPSANLGRGKVIVIGLTGSDDAPAYITSFRIAAGGKPLYDALMANGRASTHGILFATGSDQIRGESKPTLDDIGQMLRQHADLKLTIEGHTDNVGAAPANQTLSDKRAAAVRQFLISNYHIDASRLVSKGFGATKPVASNDTPEGRQQNRRVDLVKN